MHRSELGVDQRAVIDLDSDRVNLDGFRHAPVCCLPGDQHGRQPDRILRGDRQRPDGHGLRRGQRLRGDRRRLRTYRRLAGNRRLCTGRRLRANRRRRGYRRHLEAFWRLSNGYRRPGHRKNPRSPGLMPARHSLTVSCPSFRNRTQSPFLLIKARRLLASR
jgi:hypothetical protein